MKRHNLEVDTKSTKHPRTNSGLTENPNLTSDVIEFLNQYYKDEDKIEILFGDQQPLPKSLQSEPAKEDDARLLLLLSEERVSTEEATLTDEVEITENDEAAAKTLLLASSNSTTITDPNDDSTEGLEAQHAYPSEPIVTIKTTTFYGSQKCQAFQVLTFPGQSNANTDTPSNQPEHETIKPNYNA